MPDGATVTQAVGFIAVILTVLMKRIDSTLYERLGALEARLHAQEKREIPPAWFKEQVNRHEKRFDLLVEKIDNLHMQCRFHPPNPGPEARPPIHTD